MADTVTLTTAGRVCGVDVEGGVVFRGIPYAAPPVGTRRFRAPAPHDRWDATRDCRAFGPICPQVQSGANGGVMQVFDSTEVMGEDCLMLNVWTPAADDAHRPTMVWIHGGGFRSGSGSCPLFDGSAFIRDGVVLVTLNYRLHAFGFAYLDELFDGATATGNLGILDQVAAIEWVRDNIGAFGGDPDNVTVFGESAGAMSIGTLLGMGVAPGLFRRAIAQSGAAHHTLTSGAADRVARRLLELLDVRPGDWEALQAVPAAAVTRAALQVGREVGPRDDGESGLLDGEFSAAMPFQPVIDGVTLRSRPMGLVAAGSAAGIDLVTGTCADELRIVAWGMPEAVQRHRLDPAVATVLAGVGRSVDDVAGRYADAWPDADDLDRWLAMETDYRYAVPAACLAVAQSKHAHAWLYRFAWPTPILGGILGSCHALDVPFVFGRQRQAAILTGDDPPTALAEVVHGSWIRFARTGDPGGGVIPPWPEYDSDRRAVMDFDIVSGVVDDPLADRRLVWQDLVEHWARASRR